MAFYTWYGNKHGHSNDFTSLVTFSTGKDMVIGEAVDLVAQEVTEVGRLTTLDIRAGNTPQTIDRTNFPPVLMVKRTAAGGKLTGLV